MMYFGMINTVLSIFIVLYIVLLIGRSLFSLIKIIGIDQPTNDHVNSIQYVTNGCCN